jgi:hypothetical protein
MRETAIVEEPSQPEELPAEQAHSSKTSSLGTAGEPETESNETGIAESLPSITTEMETSTIRVFERTRSSEGDLSLVKVFLRSTGDRKRDSLRMRRVYGLLTSYHGSDRFAVYVFEGSQRYHLEFPNDSTGYCPELHSQLLDLLGDANVQIEQLRLQ